MTEPTPPPPPERRTKRRYAHELYPHPEDEIQPLRVAVPYLYARALGFEVHSTSYIDEIERGDTGTRFRLQIMIAARGEALLADALLQGMAGQTAWDWAGERNNPEGGEWIWERAVVYGVDPEQIKPYPCGPEPEQHSCRVDGDPWPIFVPGRESDCERCTEPVT